MLYEFAITPQVFEASTLENDRALQANLIYLFKELDSNGLVANLDKEAWERVVIERVDQLPPSLRDKVKSGLAHLSDRHRLSRHPKAPKSPPTSETDWFNLALHDHPQRPLHAAVVSPSLRPRRASSSMPPVLPLHEVIESNIMEELARSVHMDQSEGDFEHILAPVLRYARKVRLIDPYMDCTEERYKATLRLCFRLMRQFTDGPPKFLECHTSCPAGTANAAFDAWESFLRPHTLSRQSNIKLHFEVFIWQSVSGGQRFHDRFIITDQCGIAAPDGLACRTEPSGTDWSLLERQGYDQHLRECDPDSSPFKPLGRRKIVP